MGSPNLHRPPRSVLARPLVTLNDALRLEFKPMLNVHHLNNSRSQRVLWLLEELGVPYEIVRYERNPKTMLAPEALRRIHPLGKSPVITDDGQAVAETGAIIEYVLGRYGEGRLMPARDTPEHLRYTYWLHYAEGSAMPPLLLKLLFSQLAKQRAPFFARPILKQIASRVQQMLIDPQLALHTGFWESELGKNPWFAGETFTAADIQMSFPVEAAAIRVPFGGKYPELQNFLDRIHSRPAYQRAIERGGPYSLLR
jgi:glutathione S-transferase